MSYLFIFSWTCVYPIYLDAKRPYGKGQRRVARAKGLWWPLSKDIADAASRLGLGTLHEDQQSAPSRLGKSRTREGAMEKGWQAVNPVIKTSELFVYHDCSSLRDSHDCHTEKQLLEMICYQLQILKPENVPKPPYNVGTLPIPPPPSQKVPDSSQTQPSPSIPTSSTNAQKGKGGKHKSTPSQAPGTKSDSPNLPKPVKHRVPIPPDPYPPLSSRLSAYSPVVASGMLIDTVKAGMSAQADLPILDLGQMPRLEERPKGSGRLSEFDNRDRCYQILNSDRMGKGGSLTQKLQPTCIDGDFHYFDIEAFIDR
jgi:signal recognition particle subunit SRP19